MLYLTTNLIMVLTNRLGISVPVHGEFDKKIKFMINNFYSQEPYQTKLQGAGYSIRASLTTCMTTILTAETET